MLSSHPASDRVVSARPVRRHRRLLYSIPLSFHHLGAGGIRSSRGISLDISESGIGALVEGQLQVGETVGIDAQLPDSLLSVVAIVRYTSAIRSGFEFVGLTPEERQYIANLVGTA